MRLKSVQSRVGIAAIEDQTLVDFNLNLTRCFEIKGINIWHESDEMQGNYIEQLERYFASMDSEVRVQFYYKSEYGNDRILEEVDLEAGTEKRNILIEDSKSQYASLETRTLRTYLYISVDPSPMPSLYIPYIFDQINVSDQAQGNRARLDRAETGIRALLKQIGVSVRQLSEQEIFELCFSFLNPSSVQHVGVPDHDPLLSFSGQVCRSAIENQHDGLVLDGMYCTTINIDKFPKVASSEFLQTLLFQIEFDYELSIAISVPDQEAANQKIVNRQQVIKSTQGLIKQILGVENQSVSDRKEQDSYQEMDTVLDILAIGEQQICMVSICLVLKAKNKNEVQQRANRVLQLLSGIHHSLCLRDDYNHLSNFMSVLPGQAYINKRHHRVLSNSVSVLVPLVQEYSGTEEMQMVFRTKQKQLIPFSFENNGNPANHVLVIGPTGKGKSFCCNWLVKNLYLSSPRNYISIIDKGGSYRKLISIIGGEYINIEIDEQYAINIFPKKNDICPNNKMDKDQLVFIRKLIVLIIAQDEKAGINQVHEHLIEKTICSFYEEWQSGSAPLLEDYQEYLTESEFYDEEFVQELVDILSVYVDEEGVYSVLLNKESQIDFRNPYLCFDLNQLKNHPRLQKIYFFLINHLCSLRMTEGVQEGKRQDIIYDEVWDFLGDEYTGALISEQYRTARKYGARIWCISQLVTDFLDNPNVDAIRENAYLKIFLQMKSPDQCELLSGYGLNQNEINITKKLALHSEFFVKLANTSFVGTLSPSKLDMEICSTDKDSIERYSDSINCPETLWKEVQSHAS